MLEKFEFGAEVATAIAAAEAALAEIVATRPALAEAAEATALAYDRAQHRWENFQRHVTRVTRHGADDGSPVLVDMIDSERGKRDAAGVAMTRARKDLENCDWVIECRTADLKSAPPDGRAAEAAARPRGRQAPSAGHRWRRRHNRDAGRRLAEGGMRFAAPLLRECAGSITAPYHFTATSRVSPCRASPILSVR
jgi:hypothetical protein